jgi:hypothetical protein
MAVTAHYINSEGHLAEHLIAFRRIKGQHTGSNIGQALFSIFDDAGITHKVGSFQPLHPFCRSHTIHWQIGHITLDNASNNNTLMAELEAALMEQGQVFGRHFNRIR